MRRPTSAGNSTATASVADDVIIGRMRQLTAIAVASNLGTGLTFATEVAVERLQLLVACLGRPAQ